jgi:glycosyltransferase involved in cell wall biosynthesis
VKVRVYPSDRGGCGHYRLILPALNLADDDVHIEGGLQEIGIETPVTYAGVTTNVRTRQRITCDADVAVFQRVTSREKAQIISELQAQGTAVVVDVDDDLDALPTGHPYKPDAIPGHGRDVLHEACDRADLVTVSTPALAERYGAHGRVMVLPNCIPESYLKLGRKNAAKTVGWTGSTVTHVKDLEVCGNGIAKALTDTGARFLAVGTGMGVRKQLRLKKIDATGGWVPFEEYPKNYQKLDVAVVPLVLNRFNQAKSWLKGLEAAALSVPFVASPTAPYRELADLGAGLLAHDPGEWRRHVAKVLTQREFAANMIGNGRCVAAEWTYERRAWAWLEAWDQARMNRSARCVA